MRCLREAVQVVTAAEVADYGSPEYLLREEREWIILLGKREEAVRAASAYVKQAEGAEEDWPAWVDDLDALADDLRDGTAETEAQLRGE